MIFGPSSVKEGVRLGAARTGLLPAPPKPSGRLQEDSRRKASGRYLRKEGLRKVPQEVLRKVSKECLRKTSTKSKYWRSADYLNGTITKTYHLEHLGTMGPIYV